MYEVGAKVCMVAEETSIIKRKPSTSSGDKNKNALKTSQEQRYSHQLQGQVHNSINFSFGKRFLGHSA